MNGPISRRALLKGAIALPLATVALAHPALPPATTVPGANAGWQLGLCTLDGKEVVAKGYARHQLKHVEHEDGSVTVEADGAIVYQILYAGEEASSWPQIDHAAVWMPGVKGPVARLPTPGFSPMRGCATASLKFPADIVLRITNNGR